MWHCTLYNEFRGSTIVVWKMKSGLIRKSLLKSYFYLWISVLFIGPQLLVKSWQNSFKVFICNKALCKLSLGKIHIYKIEYHTRLVKSWMRKKIQMESGHLAIAQIKVDLSCSPWANMLLIVVLKYKYLNKT